MKTPISEVPAFFILLACISSLILFDKGVELFVIPFTVTLISLGFLLVITVKTEPSWEHVVLIVLLLSFLASFYLISRVDTPEETGGLSLFKAEVVDERPWGSKRVAILDDGSHKILLKSSARDIFKPGDILEIKGLLLPLKDPAKGIDSGFNEKRYWFAHGVRQQIMPYQIDQKTDESGSSIIVKWRTWLRERIDLSLPSPLRGYILAAWLGVRDPELGNRHSLWGTSHLLAVSGFHVGLIAGIIFLLFRRYRFRALVISVFMWLYIMLTGFHASAVRAGIMLQMVLVGEIFHKPLSPLNSVCFSAALMLMYNPWYFWDLGWRLSVSSVIAIVSFFRLSPSRNVQFAVSPVVWVATYPLISRTFGTVPFAGIIINIAAIPVFAFILPILSLCALLIISDLFFSDLVITFSQAIVEGWEYGCNIVSSIIPYELAWSLPIAVIAVNILVILFLKAMSVEWKRVIIIMSIMNMLIPFLSGSVVV